MNKKRHHPGSVFGTRWILEASKSTIEAALTVIKGQRRRDGTRQYFTEDARLAKVAKFCELNECCRFNIY